MSARDRSVRLRPAVRWFAEQMELKLRRHDEKRGRDGWLAMINLDFLVRRTYQEMAELDRACIGVRDMHSPDIKQAIAEEAADVANFAMMIADNVRHRP